MAFVQALSGLYGASKGLDVIGNNIANTSTVGFKTATSEFSDVFANAIRNTPGTGVSVQAVSQKFTQGSIASTNNALDFSINGNGMFRLADKADGSGLTAYSRNGEFHFAKVPDSTTEAYIANANGKLLTGWAKGVATTEAPKVLKLTNGMDGSKTTNSTLTVNVDGRSKDIPATTAFDKDNPESFSWVASQQVYAGVNGDLNTHTMAVYFAKRSDSSFDVYTRIDGQAPSEEAGGPRQMSISPAGLLTASSPLTISSTVATKVGQLDANGLPLTDSSGTQLVTTGTSDVSLTLDLSGSTAYAAPSEASFTNQNGYADGRLLSLKLEADGGITGQYSNSRNGNVGTVALATFVNPNGLRSVGENLWLETAASGTATVGKANTQGRGAMASNSLEQSNVDLAEELINMITMQRNYQANSQMIKTQDEVLRTLAALK